MRETSKGSLKKSFANFFLRRDGLNTTQWKFGRHRQLSQLKWLRNQESQPRILPQLGLPISGKQALSGIKQQVSRLPLPLSGKIGGRLNFAGSSKLEGTKSCLNTKPAFFSIPIFQV